MCIRDRNNAVVPIAKSPRKAIVQSGGAARELSKIPRERKSPEPTALNTIHPVAKIKNFIEVGIFLIYIIKSLINKFFYEINLFGRSIIVYKFIAAPF